MNPIKELKWRWQRVQRGWADSDAWSACDYLSPIIEGICRKIAEDGVAYSSNSKEEWDEKLIEIADALREYREADNVVDFPRLQAATVRQEKALKVFAEIFPALWD